MTTAAPPVAEPFVRQQPPAPVRRKRFLVAVADHSLLIVAAIVFLAPFLFIVLTAFMTNAQALSPDLWPHPPAPPPPPRRPSSAAVLRSRFAGSGSWWASRPTAS